MLKLIGKKQIISVLLIITGCISSLEILGQNIGKNIPGGIEKEFYKGSSIRITFVKENIVRIQIAPKGGTFKESALNRYGFIQDISTAKLNVKITESGNGFSAETPQLIMKGNNLSGEIVITDATGKKILLSQSGADFLNNYSQVTFNADKDEDWIGFGDQTRKRLYHRGYMADCNVRNAQSYIPVPFFMSTAGTGVLVNTTHHIIFDMAKTNPNQYSWKDNSGVVDYYEDDGISFEHLEGKNSNTRISARTTGAGSAKVDIESPKGDFKGMVKNRTWNITMHADSKPVNVSCNGNPVSSENYSWDESRKELSIKRIVAPSVILTN